MLTTLVFVLSYDIWFYISHLILHNKHVYKYHKKHHAHVNPTWLDTNDGSIFENGLQSLGLIFPLFLFPTAADEFSTVVALVGIRALMRHDERCTFLVGNHHLLHHKHQQYNFGEFWLDAICGTMYPNYAEHRRGIIFFL